MGLKKLRKAQRYSQEQVAELLGTHTASIWRIEHMQQNPTIDQIKKLAKLYKVSITTIVNAYEEQDD